MLTASKRLLSKVSSSAPIGCCPRYCGHRDSATVLATHQRPLPHHLGRRSRPKADMGMAAAPSQRPMTSANTLPNLAMAALLSTIGAVV